MKRYFPIFMLGLAGFGIVGLLLFPNLMVDSVKLNDAEMNTPFSNELPMYVVTNTRKQASSWQMEEVVWKDGHLYLANNNLTGKKNQVAQVKALMSNEYKYYELKGSKDLSVWFGNYDQITNENKKLDYEVIIYNTQTQKVSSLKLSSDLSNMDPVTYIINNNQIEIIFSGKTSELNFWKEMELKKVVIKMDSKGDFKQGRLIVMPDKFPTLIPKLG